jgi:hypothetical protein
MDNDDVTVLLVWNGPGVASKWQLGEIISALRKRKASRDDDEEEEEEEQTEPESRTILKSKRAR